MPTISDRVLWCVAPHATMLGRTEPEDPLPPGAWSQETPLLNPLQARRCVENERPKEEARPNETGSSSPTSEAGKIAPGSGIIPSFAFMNSITTNATLKSSQKLTAPNGQRSYGRWVLNWIDSSYPQHEAQHGSSYLVERSGTEESWSRRPIVRIGSIRPSSAEQLVL
ncbi:hypothetical protein VNO77_27820 [Canavalia gladiata]|uniref:Uncharacterized protein n=1 Tax=Canavalia gladiata TaxID=3824 RepID=A0AAN9QAV2_CANGL